MKPSHLNAYVPEAFFSEGKEQMPCPPFMEDFALLDAQNEYRILARRGLFLKVGEALPLSDEERDLLRQTLQKIPTRSERCAPRIFLRTEEHAVILFTDLFLSCGLLVALLPHEKIGLVSHTIPYLAREGDVLSHALSDLPKGNGIVEECYAALSEQIRRCEEILSPAPDTDFRLHAAHVARLAGCLASVISLPVGSFPLSEVTAMRWSAFLLGLFLLLRGDSATPTKLELTCADTQAFHLRITHAPEAKRKIPLDRQLTEFLSRPCFSEIQLSKADGKLILLTALSRKHGLLLRADPYGREGMEVVLEIVIE